MRRLWAPWRVAYVTGPKTAGCLLCDLQASDDATALIVHRERLGYLVLNRYPYNSGHLMAVPNRHVARPEHLSADEAAALMRLVALAIRALERAMAPEGYNVGMNLGRAAGAGIDDHLHVHVVPRWVGDTNYMPVVGEVKVLPEGLEDTHRRLVAAVEAVTASD